MTAYHTQYRTYPRHVFVKETGITVAAAGNTTLATLDVKGQKRLSFEVVNQGAQAFDAFTIQGRFHENGDYVNLYTTGYTTPTGILQGASGDLTTLASAATGWFIMDVSGLESVRVTASAAAGGTSADIYAGAGAF